MRCSLARSVKKVGFMKESDIQKAILAWLAAKHILAFRMNTGAMAGEHNGKKRFMRFGTPGMADILAFPVFLKVCTCDEERQQIFPTWIEVKAEKGKQSEFQKSFQAQVEEAGHRYILAKSVEDVDAILG